MQSCNNDIPQAGKVAGRLSGWTGEQLQGGEQEPVAAEAEIKQNFSKEQTAETGGEINIEVVEWPLLREAQIMQNPIQIKPAISWYFHPNSLVIIGCNTVEQGRTPPSSFISPVLRIQKL